MLSPDPHPYTATPELRLAWARQRFFDDGIRPTGLVSEDVIQSWSRCLALHQSPQRTPEFNPVTRSRLHGLLSRHHSLLLQAGPELAQLAQALARTPALGLLLDAQGVVMHRTRAPQPGDGRLLQQAARVGVCLAESQIGTAAPGVTLCTGRACSVSGGEHFAQAIAPMHCVAAPLRDAQGRLVAVLNLSSEGRPFGFDAAGLVALHATAIENEWLCGQADQPLVVALQVQANLLATPLVGLLGVDEHGALCWFNRAAAGLLGQQTSWPELPQGGLFGLLGLGAEALLARQAAARDQAWALRLPSGLAVWVKCHGAQPGASARPVVVTAPPPTQVTAPSAAASAEQAAAPALPSLRGLESALINRTLADCQGNVSQAARRLRVSRGLIYRHLRGTHGGEPQANAGRVPGTACTVSA